LDEEGILMTQFIEQLLVRFAAGAPGFYVNTPEEARLDALLASMAQAQELRIVEWNLGLGQVRFDTKQPVGEPQLKPDLSAFWSACASKASTRSAST